MEIELGLILAFTAMIAWGFGDFFIQKSVRKVGNWTPLLAITFVGALSLLPFVYNDLHHIYSDNNFLLLMAGGIILFFAAILDFEALKRGKLSVIEPLWSLEIVFTSLMSFIILKEWIGFNQVILIISLFSGLILTSLRDINILKRIFLERGVILGIISASMMGLANFFLGWSAREADPLLAKWFFDVVIVIFCLVIMISNKKIYKVKKEIMSNKKTMISMCICDNLAWTAFAISMVLLPIAIATALSESYIIIAVLLGMYVNKEKIRKHQKIGLIIAIFSAITLAYLSV